jgi:hypothetical protein
MIWPSWWSAASRGGQLTLTNAIMSLKPVYTMGALRLPKSAVDCIDKTHRAMLWKGAAKCSGGDFQVALTTTCRLKEEDGLGITDLETQNTCLLLKTVDKLIAGHCNPWADWVRFWYTPGLHIVPTAAWSMFQRFLTTYRSLTIVNVGAGEATSFWFDSWSTTAPSPRRFRSSSPTVSIPPCPWGRAPN